MLLVVEVVLAVIEGIVSGGKTEVLKEVPVLTSRSLRLLTALETSKVNSWVVLAKLLHLLLVILVVVVIVVA